MSYIYPARVELGTGYAGQTANVRYKILDLSGATTVAETNTGVTASEVSGNYHVLNGVSLPAGYVGRCLWGINSAGVTTWMAEATVDLQSNVIGEIGPIQFTYTVYDTDQVTPLGGVTVYVAADAGGLVRSRPRVTDDLGRVVFQLNAGLYYFFRSKPGKLFDLDTELVS